MIRYEANMIVIVKVYQIGICKGMDTSSCLVAWDWADIQGDFFHWASPKKLKYGKPRLGESTLT